VAEVSNSITPSIIRRSRLATVAIVCALAGVTALVQIGFNLVNGMFQIDAVLKYFGSEAQEQIDPLVPIFVFYATGLIALGSMFQLAPSKILEGRQAIICLTMEIVYAYFSWQMLHIGVGDFYVFERIGWYPMWVVEGMIHPYPMLVLYSLFMIEAVIISRKRTINVPSRFWLHYLVGLIAIGAISVAVWLRSYGLVALFRGL